MKNTFTFLLFLFALTGLVAQTTTPAECLVTISSTINITAIPRTVSFKTDHTVEVGSKYLWTFSDGQVSDSPTPTKSFQETNSYSVTLKITRDTQVCNGKYEFKYETGTVTNPVVTNVAGKGKVLSIGTAPCGTTITLDNGTVIVVAQTVPTFTYRVGQYLELSYELMPAGTSACPTLSGTSVKITKISEIVVPTVCNIPITFTKSTTIPPIYTFTAIAQADGSVFSWTFGDGGTSALAAPTHSFKISGSYVINLKVVDKSGKVCASEIKETFVGEANPPLSGKGTVKRLVTIDCEFAIVLDGGVTLIPHIMLPNFAFSEGQKVEFTYEKLAEKVNKCKEGTDIKVVTIKEILVAPACKAYFTFSRVDQSIPKKIAFSNMSIGDISELTWNFGDNTPVSKELKATHEFAVVGEYKVCLSIKTKTGCSSEYCTTVKVETPIVNTGCKFDIVVKPKTGTSNTFLFYAVSQVEITKWSWKFGDTKISDAKNPEHAYEKAGTYEVTCIVTTANGCTETRSIKQTVLAATLTTCSGAISFILYDATNLCNGKATAKLLNNDGVEITTAKFLWSDGRTTSTVENLCPDKPYSVQIYLENNCQKNASFTLLSKPLWKAATINGMNSFSVIDPKDGVSYEWDFGNGTVLTGTDVSYNFAQNGTYDVKLKAAYGSDFTEFAQQVVVLNSITKTEMIDKSELEVYPNPVKDMLRINFGNPVVGKLFIEIIDIKGRRAYSQQLNTDGYSQAGVNIQQLKAGIYFLRITNGSNLIADRKFIKAE
jgi:PKD repeat protein